MDWKVILVIFMVANLVTVRGVISPADIIMLLDSSDNTRSTNFEAEERFAVQFVKTVYSRENKIGLFTYGKHTHNQFLLNSYNDIQQIQQAIKYMWYSTGDGSVAPAVNYTLTHGFTESSGDRECVPNILVILTHSEIDDLSTAMQLSESLRDQSVRTFVLNMAATSSFVNFATLTNDTARVINIDGFQTLEQSVPVLLQKVNSDVPNTGCGKLTQWQPWSKCSASCGQGLRFRLRQCTKEQTTDKDCAGDLSEDSACAVAACTEPVDGRWAHWNSWSACSKTCSIGIQTRTRECAAPVPQRNGKLCPGVKKEQRNCSEWQCPDCKKRCPVGGSMSKDCQVCECSSATLFGRITDENKLPIENADVFLQSRRYKAIANTNEIGEFIVTGICLMNEKIFTSASHHASQMQIPSQLNATHWTINGTLEKYIAPVFTVQPNDKSRMVGQSFSLCCSAVGNPKPAKYTWLKDDIVLQNAGTDGKLTISSATKSDTGHYKCSTETLAGVSQSDEAVITITDFAADTCGAPVSKIERLPDGCFLSGDKAKNTTIEVGTCGGRQCMLSSLNDNGTCSDWWPHYCCDSKDVEILDIDCDGFSFKTTRVKSCQCNLCIYRTTISGRAIGRNKNKDVPFKLGSIYVGGKQLARTNMAGFFKFDVPKGSRRVVATFHDAIFKMFLDITKIITVTDGEDVYATVVVPLRPTPIPFNTSHHKEIALGTGLDGLPPVASLSIQKESFLTSDGQIYTGAAKASIHFMDPRDRDSLDTANGDFVSESPDGSKTPLKTYGMFQLGVTDHKGNPLQIQKPMKFTLDGSLFNVTLDDTGEPDLALWDYDANKGIWTENTKLKFESSIGGKRRLLQSSKNLVATLKSKSIPKLNEYDVTYHTEKRWTGEYTNCDHSVKVYDYVPVKDVKLKEGICYVSVSVYSDMNLVEPFSRGTVTITAYTQELDGSTYLGKQESRNLDNGHACLMVFCDKLVYLTAVSDSGEELIPAKHNVLPFYPIKPSVGNEVKFESRDFGKAFTCSSTSCTGPMYQYRDRLSCKAAANDKSFRFNFAFFTKPPVMKYATGSENVYDQKVSWYPVSPDKSTFRTCFFKVMLKVYETYDMRIFATSYLRTFGGDQFGTHIVGPTPKPNSLDFTTRAACLEFRCPGYVKDGSTEVFDAPTAVDIRLKTSNTSLKCDLNVPVQLQSDITPINGSTGVTGLHFMAKAGNNYGSSFGVFINDAHKTDVERFCKSGLDSGPHIGAAMDPVKNYAVEIDCLT